jgi:hypothetical protein
MPSAIYAPTVCKQACTHHPSTFFTDARNQFCRLPSCCLPPPPQVRNCYWVGTLWAASLRALDRGGSSQEDIRAVFERACTAGMQVGVTPLLQAASVRDKLMAECLSAVTCVLWKAVKHRGPRAAAAGVV